MSSDFDPAEFDLAPSTSSPEADYTVLLDAMRQAGSDGVRAALDPVNRSLADLRAQITELQQAERTLRSANAVMFWENAKHLLLYTAVSAVILAGTASAYWLVKDPKVEVRPYGCTTGWDPKKNDCKGKWVPLVSQNGPSN